MTRNEIRKAALCHLAFENNDAGCGNYTAGFFAGVGWLYKHLNPMEETMTPHKHRDLIIQWADGAKIQLQNESGVWIDLDTPNWEPYLTYRIKPTPQWHDNIPKHGVLCWVWDKEDGNGRFIEIIMRYERPKFYDVRDTDWKFAEPLTDQEIKQFLRGDP